MAFWLGCKNEAAMEPAGTAGSVPLNDLVIDEKVESEIPASRAGNNDQMPQKGMKLIKNGNMVFEVSDLAGAKKRVDMTLKASGGYYENDQYNSYGNKNSFNLKLRIPAAGFDTLVHALEDGVGRLQSKNIGVTDVSEEYLDLNIRLTNQLAYLEQYKAILKKATTIKDILEVQENIRQLEETIESKKGRIKFLDDQVSYSTLNVELYQTVAIHVSGAPSFFARLKNAFKNGIDVLLDIIVAATSIWPIIIIILALIFGRRSILSMLRKNQGSPPSI